MHTVPTDPQAGAGTTARSTGAVTIRIAFLCVLLIFPIELAVKKFTGAEPYPALFLPGFGQVLERDDVVRFKEPVIVGITDAGSRVTLDPARVMPGAGGGYSVVFEKIFTDQQRVESREAQQWLERQLAQSYPEELFRSVVFTWFQTNYDSRTGATSRDELQSYTIDLQGAS